MSRFLFIVLMLVLLPLRGWAGNVMAVDMVATSLVQAKAASMAGLMPMSADCVMHSQPPLDDASSHCSSCDTCELCMTAASLAPAVWSADRLARQPSLLAVNAIFSSAIGAANLKPPIA
jgi:hypothetical protein